MNFALLYHGGWCSSCISARMTASKKPANIPAKWPTKSTFGEMVDIMMQLVHLSELSEWQKRNADRKKHIKNTLNSLAKINSDTILIPWFYTCNTGRESLKRTYLQQYSSVLPTRFWRLQIPSPTFRFNSHQLELGTWKRTIRRSWIDSHPTSVG